MKYFFLLLASLFLIGCTNKEFFSYEKISSEEAREIINENKNILVLDVRSREEFDEDHIDGAYNLPYNEISELIDIDKNTIIFVYCKSGSRSKIAAEKLLELGYRVYDLGAYESIDLKE